MSEFDDIEEINLSGSFVGSAKNIRACRKNFKLVGTPKPKWKKQLLALKTSATKRFKATEIRD